MDAREVDIRPLATQLLKDLDHPYSAGQNQYDVTFENVQAAARIDYPSSASANYSRWWWALGDLVGTGARLVHLWRGRPHVALQRQCLPAQDVLIQHMTCW